MTINLIATFSISSDICNNSVGPIGYTWELLESKGWQRLMHSPYYAHSGTRFTIMKKRLAISREKSIDKKGSKTTTTTNE